MFWNQVSVGESCSQSFHQVGQNAQQKSSIFFLPRYDFGCHDFGCRGRADRLQPAAISTGEMAPLGAPQCHDAAIRLVSWNNSPVPQDDSSLSRNDAAGVWLGHDIAFTHGQAAPAAGGSKWYDVTRLTSGLLNQAEISSLIFWTKCGGLPSGLSSLARFSAALR